MSELTHRIPDRTKLKEAQDIVLDLATVSQAFLKDMYNLEQDSNWKQTIRERAERVLQTLPGNAKALIEEYDELLVASEYDGDEVTHPVRDARIYVLSLIPQVKFADTLRAFAARLIKKREQVLSHTDDAKFISHVANKRAIPLTPALVQRVIRDDPFSISLVLDPDFYTQHVGSSNGIYHDAEGIILIRGGRGEEAENATLRHERLHNLSKWIAKTNNPIESWNDDLTQFRGDSLGRPEVYFKPERYINDLQGEFVSAFEQFIASLEREKTPERRLIAALMYPRPNAKYFSQFYSTAGLRYYELQEAFSHTISMLHDPAEVALFEPGKHFPSPESITECSRKFEQLFFFTSRVLARLGKKITALPESERADAIDHVLIQMSILPPTAYVLITVDQKNA
ncbi:MAG: hypothetical protein WAX38_01135 [Minisyncoccia bacterium]